MTKVKESIRTPRPARTCKSSKRPTGRLPARKLPGSKRGPPARRAGPKKFTDKASGKEVKRPQLEAMQSFVREGNTVFCHSMDRLARNLDDLRRIVLGLTERGIPYRLCEGKPDLHRRGFAHVEFDAERHGGLRSVRERADPRAPARGDCDRKAGREV
jgi:hypothetical protein